MKILPRTGAIGAAIEGIRLAEIDDSIFAEIRSAFLTHCMLVFPGQFLAPEDHFAFARRWGKPAITPMLSYVDGYPGLLRVENRGKENAVTENWHYDSTFIPAPHAVTVLAAQQLPETGGDTMWSNQYLAYDTLSGGMKLLLKDLRGKFCGTRIARRTEYKSEIPFAFHPIARTHPETGRKALFVGKPGETLAHFENMTEEESLPIIRFLYEHSTRPDHVYRHQWKPGDVVVWDNRCTMHYAVHDYGEAVRDLNRITIEGSIPI